MKEIQKAVKIATDNGANDVATYLKEQVQEAKNLKIALGMKEPFSQQVLPKIFEYTGPSRGGKKHKTKKHKTKKNRQKHKKTKQKRLHSKHDKKHKMRKVTRKRI